MDDLLEKGINPNEEEVEVSTTKRENELPIRKMPTRNEVKGLNIDKRLPQPNFRMLCVAPSYTGKSNLILNLLIDHYADMKIYIFSKSFKNDSIWDNVDIDDEFVFDSISEEIVEPIFQEQEKLKQKFKNNLEQLPKLLFVIDDLINDIKDSKTDIISKIFFRGRHLVLSTIMTSQSYNAIPKMIRTNGSHLVFFSQASAKEVKTISEENAFGGISQKDFLKMFVYATESEPFSFLYIDRKTNDNSIKFRKRFDTAINVVGENIVETEISSRLQKEDSEVVEEEAIVPVQLNKDRKTKKSKKDKKKKKKKKRRDQRENALVQELLQRDRQLRGLFG